MKVIKISTLLILVLLLNLSIVLAQSGSGDVKVGYVYLDEEGNQSVSQSSFNYYDGPVVSIENFRYRFNNGLQIKSNLRNLNLENRNLSFELSKTGMFGVDVNTNRYSRVYDFDGDSETKRDLTSGGIWFYPNKHVKVFADGSFNSVSGEINDLFNAGDGVFTREVDYDRSKYDIGIRVKHKNNMFHAEYNTISYVDNNDELKDQTRERVKLIGYMKLPGYDWVVLSGLYQNFNTKYDISDNEFNSISAKGSILAHLTESISLNYIAYFNRAGSDDDLVETENVSHLIYATYSKYKQYGITFGYQKDTNDDFEDNIEASSYYLSGWYRPTSNLEFNIMHGFRSEEVDQGFRLTGNEDRNRIKAYGKYKVPDFVSIKLGFESKERENEQLESEADYSKYFVEASLPGNSYFVIAGGYSYSNGNYQNSVSTFEFTSNQVYLNLNTKEYKDFIGGFGLSYYRTDDDLDTEGVNLLFSGSYQIGANQKAEVTYRVFNFDDYLAMDQYYTENIVEFNLIKSFSF